jgi:FtsH-binding integral membrane protein
MKPVIRLKQIKPRPKKGTVIKWFCGVSFLAAILIGATYALTGLALALLIVSGMFVTIEFIPFFHEFATSKIGMPIVVLATALVVAKVVSITSIVGMFALAFSLTLKIWLLKLVRAYDNAQMATYVAQGAYA